MCEDEKRFERLLNIWGLKTEKRIFHSSYGEKINLK